MEDPELEEGEACYYKDDASIDPDIALSYIDEKLQSVLGHFQKDFEGGVSAENLGAKFGGYGSFLPTYQRSPSIWSQPKTPQRVQNYGIPRSPNNLPAEAAPHKVPSDGTSYEPPQVRHENLSHNQKALSGDGPTKQDSYLSLAQVAEKLPLKHEPSSSKPVNPTDQRPLRVKIKVCPNNTAQKNAIYSGLGLISPSSSMGNSSEESGGVPSESQGTPCDSPASILQIMTSFPVYGGMLLSPLNDDLLCMTRNGRGSQGRKYASVLKSKVQNSSTSLDDSAPMLRDRKALKKKKAKLVGKCEILEEMEQESNMNFEDNMISRSNNNTESETLRSNQRLSNKLKLKSLSNSISNAGDSFTGSGRASEASVEAEKDVSVKIHVVNKDSTNDRLLSTDLSKENSLESISEKYSHKFEHQEVKNNSMEKIREHQVRNSFEDLSFNSGESGRRKFNIVPAPRIVDPNVSKCERDFQGGMNHLKQNVGPKATSSGQDEVEIHATKRLSSKGKKKSKGSQSNSKFSEDVAEESLMPCVSDGKKKYKRGQSKDKDAEESLRAGVSATLKDKKNSEKGACKVSDSYKDAIETGLEYTGSKVDILEKPSGNRAKNSNVEYVKQHAFVDRSRGSSICERIDNQLPSEILLKDASKDGPPTNGLASETELASVAPLVIEEDWVCCDCCQKWRLLPYGTKPDQLPEKWLCSMLNWLPGMNHCNISEEETTNALRALYQLPLPESQSNIQNSADKTVFAVTLAGAQHINQNHQNLSYDAMPNRGKKKHKLKETLNNTNNCGLTQTTNLTKNSWQELVKSRSLNDTHQPLLEISLMNKSNSQHPSKLLNLDPEKPNDKQKDKRVDLGDKKLKRKGMREFDQYQRGTLKKIKTEGLDTESFWPSKHDGDLGIMGLSSSTGLPANAAGKGMQKDSVENQSKDANLELKKNSVKKLIHCTQVQFLQKNGSLDRKQSDGKAIYVKKRKLKDGKADQNDVGTFCHNGSRVLDSKGSMKEVSTDSEFRRKKKSRVPRATGKDLSSNKCDDGSNRRGRVTRIPSSDVREDLVDSSLGNAQQPSKYRAKIAYRITLDDIESLKRDLGSEQLSMTATSSSSKVSDLHKFRANYQEGKSSPVESVSSSPLRTSNLEKLSPGRMGALKKDEPKNGDLFTTENPRKSLDGDCNVVSSQPGRRKGKASDAFHPESFGSSVLDFRDCDARDKRDGNAESIVKNPSDLGNYHLSRSDVDTLVSHSPRPVDAHWSDCCYGEDNMNKKLPSSLSLSKKSEKGSSLWKDKERSYIYNSERVTGKLSDPQSEPECLNLMKSLRDGMQLGRHDLAPCNEDLGCVKHQITDGLCMKSTKDDMRSSKKGSGKWSNNNRRETRLKFEDRATSDLDLGAEKGASAQQNLIHDFEGEAKKSSLTRVESRGVKSVNPQHEGQEDTLTQTRQSASVALNGSILDAQLLDASTGDDVSKVLKQSGHAVHQNGAHQGLGNYVPNQCVGLEFSAPSNVKKDVFSQSASNALKEAEELRDYADHLKNSGFGFECNEVYFQAALKFLHGASLLETSNSKGSKPREMSQMQIYSSTARLCEICAREYEKRQEMAAAALAYKCMEVAYMRVVYCKNLSTSRDWHDLQASLQMAPQGDSPSSSASDLDNLNNQGTLDKAALSKGMGSHAGSHVIGPRVRPNFVRLLDFTKDVNSAMVASRKSQDAFAAANVILEGAQNREGLLSVKGVVDFSFQDVDELVRLVRLASEAISRRGFGGSRD